jgi:transcriptional regulator with XRE-family HTH domain
VKTALAHLRRKMGISQDQLSNMCGTGYDQKLISQIETLRLNPRESEINRIARVLGYNEPPETLLWEPEKWMKTYGATYGFRLGEDNLVELNTRTVQPDDMPGML